MKIFTAFLLIFVLVNGSKGHGQRVRQGNRKNQISDCNRIHKFIKVWMWKTASSPDNSEICATAIQTMWLWTICNSLWYSCSSIRAWIEVSINSYSLQHWSPFIFCSTESSKIFIWSSIFGSADNTPTSCRKIRSIGVSKGSYWV